MAESRKYNVIVSDRAKQMLGSHIRFLAQVSKTAAQKEKKLLIDALRSLSAMPQRFPFFEDESVPRNKYHKLFVEKQYLILFQIKDNTVEVDYILDCRQDYGWLIR